MLKHRMVFQQADGYTALKYEIIVIVIIFYLNNYNKITNGWLRGQVTWNDEFCVISQSKKNTQQNRWKLMRSH